MMESMLQTAYFRCSNTLRYDKVFMLYFCCFSEHKKNEEYDGIDRQNLVTLQRLKQTQRQDYLKVSIIFYNLALEKMRPHAVGVSSPYVLHIQGSKYLLARLPRASKSS